MRKGVFPALLFALLTLGSPSLAQDDRRTPYATDVQPLDRILPGIRNGYPGHFYDADGPYPDADGRLHYRIKWLTPEGRIVWLDADARTGRVIGPAAGAPWFVRRPFFGPPLRRVPAWGPRFGGPWRGGHWSRR